jgi:spatacsin
MHGLEFFTMPMKILEKLVTVFTEGSGRGLCKRIIAVVKAANVLGLSFLEAFDKQPIDLLQLLALKAQESFEQASLIVQTHSMPAASIARILAESFLKVWRLFSLVFLFSLAYFILKLMS